MKKLLLSFVIGLLSSIGLMAQSSLPWTPATNEDYENEMVVYAGLTRRGEAQNWVWDTYVAAFIDDECRGIGEIVRDETRDIAYATLRIAGSAADNNKTVKFKIWQSENIYSMTETTTFSSETTVGTLSSLFTFAFNTPDYYMFTSDVEITIGETANLRDHVKFVEYGTDGWVEIENPTLPDVLPWFFEDSEQNYATLEGNYVKGVAETPANQPVKVGLGMQCKIVDGEPYLSVTVKKPEVLIESITLSPNVQDGITVNVGDWSTLTSKLTTCYTVNPANATEVPSWSCSDATAIIYTEVDGTDGNVWNPVKVGEYVMTLSSQNCQAQLTVNVIRPVEGVFCQVNGLFVQIGQSISGLLPYAYGFLPADATNKEVTYTVQNPAGKVIIDASYKAVSSGRATVKVTSQENPELYCEITVWVSDIYSISAVQNPLLLLYGQDGTNDVSTEVMENVVVKNAAGELEDIGCSFTIADESVISSTCTDEGDLKFYTLKTGSTKITAYYMNLESYYDAVDERLREKTIETSCTFDVNVLNRLSGLSISNLSVIGNTEVTYLTIEPVPSDAYFDPAMLSTTVKVNASAGFPEGWELASVEYSEGNTWTITPKSVGSGNIVLSYEGVSYDDVSINIGQTVHPEVGWKWISLYSGSMELQTIHYYYAQYLEEIRSQTQLLANDPVYGYYGDLTEMTVGTAYKVKLSKNPADYVVPFAVAPAEQTVTLKKTWTWLGNPYQYDHALSEVFASANLTQGDRIVSKSGGFAEYNGSQWTGTLTTLQNGLAYLYYNKAGQSKSLALPIETSLTQSTPAQHAAVREQSVWQYDESQWADNMTIIASVEGMDLTQSSYSVGAMVDGECRGEGQVVDGYLFITVHGQSGEQIAFCLYDADTERYTELQTRIQFGKMAGSLTEPFMMQAAETNGIHLQQLDATDRQVYDLYGRRVSGNNRPLGLYIVK